MLKREAKLDHWFSRWFFLGDSWEIAIYEAALASRYVPQVFCNPSWLKNYKTTSLTIIHVVAATTKFIQNPRLLNFIIEENLRTYGLMPFKKPSKL